MKQGLLIEVVISLAIVLSFVIYPWIRKTVSAGLPLCYLLHLGMIHVAGGLIHALPWYSTADPYTELGFHQTFLGIMSFALGSLFVAPFILRLMSRRGTTRVVVIDPSSQQARLAPIYLMLGMIFFGVLAPLLKTIPSIGAVTVSGVYLSVVGVCLLCWKAYLHRERKTLLLWLLAACLIPFITIVTLGFIGYGTVAALLVFTFVISFYRPHWHSLVALGLLTVLGLSLFVTYFRDRWIIRDKVWGDAALGERVDSMSSIFQDFELIDLTNQRHLQAIDSRLNQNYLVGRVVKTIDSGQESFARGETIYDAVLALVPRIIWQDKPVQAGSGRVVPKYTRMRFDANTSIGIGHILEFYINFGTVGVISGLMIIGVLLRIADTMAALHLYDGNWQGFMSWFAPSISLLNVQGSLIEVFGSFASSLVMVSIVNKVVSLADHSRVNKVAAGKLPAGAHYFREVPISTSNKHIESGIRQ